MITKKIKLAFDLDIPFKSRNDEITIRRGITCYFFHNSLLIEKSKDKIYFSFKGFNTRSTKSRLNLLLPFEIFQSNFKLYAIINNYKHEIDPAKKYIYDTEYNLNILKECN